MWIFIDCVDCQFYIWFLRYERLDYQPAACTRIGPGILASGGKGQWCQYSWFTVQQLLFDRFPHLRLYLDPGPIFPQPSHEVSLTLLHLLVSHTHRLQLYPPLLCPNPLGPYPQWDFLFQSITKVLVSFHLDSKIT